MSHLALNLGRLIISQSHSNRLSSRHAEGDDCLLRVAKAIAGCMRRASDFAARYGGEEFAVILPKINRDEAINMAEKIRLKVAELNISHAASKVANHVSISLGITTVSVQQGISPVDLIKAADAALYKAKENGRNQVVSLRK
ncbi:MAG: GGDEF domain-containing protein [Desulfobacteraceae bacterium]|nr:GGDEF domain-containing protein [Desulfobacteraceae bacterium]